MQKEKQAGGKRLARKLLAVSCFVVKPFQSLVTSHRSLLFQLLVTCHLSLSSFAAVPQWWITRGVINTNLPSDNYAAVNQGQLKHIAYQAALELEEKLPGGMGYVVEDLVSGFVVKTNSNYYPVNGGQLKNIAKPFYDRLIEEGYTNSYPWTETKADDANYALVNIGQVKNVFSFDLDGWDPNVPLPPPLDDEDGDGLSDGLEILFWGDLEEQDGEGDADGDGVSNQDEQNNGTNPDDPNDPGQNGGDKPAVWCAAMVLEFDQGPIRKVFVDKENRVYVFSYGDNEVESVWRFEAGAWQLLLNGEYALRDVNEKGEILLSVKPKDLYKEERKGYIFNADSETFEQLGDIDNPGLEAEVTKNSSGVISCQYVGSSGVMPLDLNDEGGVVGNYIGALYKIMTKNYSEPLKQWVYNTFTNTIGVAAYWPEPGSGYMMKNYYEGAKTKGLSSIVHLNNQAQISINYLGKGVHFWSPPHYSYAVDYFSAPGLPMGSTLTEHGLLHRVQVGSHYYHKMVADSQETYIGFQPIKEINYQAQVAIGDNYLDNNGAIWKYDQEKERYFSYEVQEVLSEPVKEGFEDLYLEDVNSNGLIVGQAAFDLQQQQALTLLPEQKPLAAASKKLSKPRLPAKRKSRSLLVSDDQMMLNNNYPNQQQQYQNAQQKVVLLTMIDITNLWSDQLPDVHANWIQKAKDKNQMYMTGQDSKPYILMGARADGKAYVKAALKDKLPKNFENALLFRLSIKGQNNPKPGTSTYDADKQEVSITAEDLGSEEHDYVVVAGYDINKNAQLDPTEISFKKDWVCKIVSQEQYIDDIDFLNDWKLALGATPLAYDCVTAFLEEATPNGATSVDIEIARNEYGLSHAVGILFQPVAEPGPSIKAVFDENSLMAERFMGCETLENWLEEQFEFKKGYVQQILNNTTNEFIQFNWQLPAIDVEFGYSPSDIDLKLSLGSVSSNKKPVHVKVKVEVASGKTVEVKTTGTLIDLYDFQYGGLLGYWVTPAARIQAGYNTLGKAGRVYKNEIKLNDSPWSGEYDFK